MFNFMFGNPGLYLNNSLPSVNPLTQENRKQTEAPASPSVGDTGGGPHFSGDQASPTTSFPRLLPARSAKKSPCVACGCDGAGVFLTLRSVVISLRDHGPALPELDSRASCLRLAPQGERRSRYRVELDALQDAVI